MTVDDKFVRYRWRLAVRLFCAPEIDEYGQQWWGSTGDVARQCGISEDTVEECIRKQLRQQAKRRR